METVLEVLLGHTTVLRRPVVEHASLVERDDVVLRLVVDDADDGCFVVFEGVFDCGLVDVIHVDVVRRAVRHRQKGTRRHCGWVELRLHVLVVHPHGGTGDVVERDDANQVERLHVEDLDGLVFRHGRHEQSVERGHQRRHGFLVGVEVLHELDALQLKEEECGIR